MKIRIVETDIEGVVLIEPESFQDDRGFFFESYSKRRFEEHGLALTFVQDNHSRSGRGVLRGLHYQDASAPQYRLVRCTMGQVWDVVVDLRVGSPTLGHWFAATLNADDKRQLLIPPEFAHGFWYCPTAPRCNTSAPTTTPPRRNERSPGTTRTSGSPGPWQIPSCRSAIAPRARASGITWNTRRSRAAAPERDERRHHDSDYAVERRTG